MVRSVHRNPELIPERDSRSAAAAGNTSSFILVSNLLASLTLLSLHILQAEPESFTPSKLLRLQQCLPWAAGIITAALTSSSFQGLSSSVFAHLVTACAAASRSSHDEFRFTSAAVVSAVLSSPCAHLFSAASLHLLGNPADLSPQDAIMKIFPHTAQSGHHTPRNLSSDAANATDVRGMAAGQQRQHLVQQEQEHEQLELKQEKVQFYHSMSDADEISAQVTLPDDQPPSSHLHRKTGSLCHKFDQIALQASQEKALAAFIDGLSTIPRISLSRSRIAELFQCRPCASETATTGEVLMRQDEMSSLVIYIVSGSVSVVQNGEKRASIQAPAMVGHHSFIYRRARTAAIICESPVVYLQVVLDELLAAALQQPTPKSSMILGNAASCGPESSSLNDPVTLQPIDRCYVHTKPQLRDISAPIDTRDVALSVRELEPTQPSDANLVHPNNHLTHSAAPPSLGLRDLLSSATVAHAVAHASPASSPSALPERGREAAVMNISDSLGMMMRQHHVRTPPSSDMGFDHCFRTLTQPPSLYLKL